MKNIILIAVAAACFLGGCQKKADSAWGRSIDEVLKICKEMDTPCYRREYAKDFAATSTSEKFGVTVSTEGEGDKILVLKTNQFRTDSLSSTKKSFIDLARMGTFRQVKLIGSDSKEDLYSTGYDR